MNTLSESCHVLIPEGDEWVSASLNSFSCIALRSPEYQTQRGTARIREDDPFGEIGYVSSANLCLAAPKTGRSNLQKFTGSTHKQIKALIGVSASTR